MGARKQDAVIAWLLESDEPWTRYRTRIDLLGQAEDHADVLAERRAMVAHPWVRDLVARAAAWPGRPFKRHNDASHPIYALSTLADFGLRHDDRGLRKAVRAVMAHRSREGAFQTLVNIPPVFGGSGEDEWVWIVCDAPTLAYALVGLGLDHDPRVAAALQQIAALADDNGWRCRATPDLAKFKGPGRRTDPCPMANVYALKALSPVRRYHRSRAARVGVEALLTLYEQRGRRGPFLFGVGTDFHKLRYPFVWYDVLHVAEVLSRYSVARRDPRLHTMAEAVFRQADADGRYAPTAMFRSFKDWSFADKKCPSPWLTFLVRRLAKRLRGRG